MLVFLNNNPTVGQKLWYFLDTTMMEKHNFDEDDLCVFAVLEVVDWLTNDSSNRLCVKFLESTASDMSLLRPGESVIPFDKICLPGTYHEIVCDDRELFEQMVNDYLGNRIIKFDKTRDKFVGIVTDAIKQGGLDKLKEKIKS